MGMFLNNPLPYKRYKKLPETTYFVDKSAILDDIFECMEEETQYICITRPRRFCKTVMANMLGAFPGKDRDDLALMVSGEGVDARIDEFAASAMELKTRNQIYSAMVVYGLLTFTNGKVYIPNRELMLKYEELLQSEKSLGYVYQLAHISDQMLKATLSGDTSKMAEILQYAHNTETPILSYNSEAELSAIVNLVYLSARDKYRIEREDKAGKDR